MRSHSQTLPAAFRGVEECKGGSSGKGRKRLSLRRNKIDRPGHVRAVSQEGNTSEEGRGGVAGW